MPQRWGSFFTGVWLTRGRAAILKLPTLLKPGSLPSNFWTSRKGLISPKPINYGKAGNCTSPAVCRLQEENLLHKATPGIWICLPDIQ